LVVPVISGAFANVEIKLTIFNPYALDIPDYQCFFTKTDGTVVTTNSIINQGQGMFTVNPL